MPTFKDAHEINDLFVTKLFLLIRTEAVSERPKSFFALCNFGPQKYFYRSCRSQMTKPMEPSKRALRWDSTGMYHRGFTTGRLVRTENDWSFINLKFSKAWVEIETPLVSRKNHQSRSCRLVPHSVILKCNKNCLNCLRPLNDSI